MALATPLLPLGMLLLGAMLLPLTKRVTRTRVRDALALVVACGFLVLSLLVYLDQPTSVTIPLWRFRLLGGELGYYADSLSLLFASLIGVITLAAILPESAFATSHQPIDPPYGALFLVALGAVSLIFAGDLVVLCFSWALLDLGLLVLAAVPHRARGASRTGLALLGTNYLAGLALLASLLFLEGLGESASLQTTLLPTRVTSLILLATLMRLGLYPALVVLPSDMKMSLPTAICWYAIPLSAGGYLLTRMLALTTVSSLPGREIALFLGSLALILGPFPVWFETSVQRAASYVVLNQVGYLALAAAIAAPYSPAIVSSQVISVTLALTLLFLARSASRHPLRPACRAWTRSCALAAVASLLGAPLTVGFASRFLLYLSLWGSGLGPLILLSLLGNSFLAAPLLKISLESAPQSSNQGQIRPLLLAVMCVLGAALVLLGLHPPLVGGLTGTQSGPSAVPPLPELISSMKPPTSVAMICAILVSLAVGYSLYYKGEIIVARAGTSLQTLQAVGRMDWLQRTVGWIVQRMALILEQLGALFEERRALGWMLLFATLIALLLLST